MTAPISPSEFLSDPNRKVGPYLHSFRRETDELAKKFNRKDITLKEEQELLAGYRLARHQRSDRVTWLEEEGDKRFIINGICNELDAILEGVWD